MDWQVYHVENCPIADKNKFVVVFENDQKYFGFLINSSHHKLLQKSHNKICVCTIDCVANTFLNHDSFINCSQEIILTANHLTDHRGEVCDDTKRKILKALLGCHILPDKYRLPLINKYIQFHPGSNPSKSPSPLTNSNTISSPTSPTKHKIITSAIPSFGSNNKDDDGDEDELNEAAEE